MSEFLDHLSANDNDIYDLLISGRPRLTESVLREFARDRGIFCSPDETRESLADYLSILPHGYHDVDAIVRRREPVHRREKTTYVRLGAELSVEELRLAADEYARAAGASEKVIHRPKAQGGFAVNVVYDEFNHARARLLQRERHEAEIEFLVQGGQTVIRLPATDKAKRVARMIKEGVERERKAVIQEESIELTGLTTPGLRSRFFTRLISSLPGFKLKNVMSLKVSSHRSEDSEEDEALDLESAGDDDASTEMFAAVVHSMALSGHNLVQSQEYKDLTSRGFFITSISWRSEHASEPADIIQFDAGFEDRKQGVGFKYAVQGAFRAHKGTHRKTITHIVDAEKAGLLALLEGTAQMVLKELLEEAREETETSVAEGDQ
ncbi:hypothetical protein E2553_16105 [Paraburkholderia dipogonis]|uniref:Uncharacterized protein n=1 Tax=Paraburkholderia dipogonis TaxID=1211383 RepID=A0A4Y8N9F8_9BURK|nr:hypothetical protein [Paraburkholderia dipogonis]TFE46417.1 hypothetical protein E2553_16105 [Paraburkholderia dipogonis]